MYIGQSCQAKGVFGRLLQHTDERSGTFYKKVTELGIDFLTLTNIEVVTYDLTKFGKFSGVYSRNRIALEYLVQTIFKAKGCKAPHPFEVISYVQPNSLVHDFELQREAECVVEEVCTKLPFFVEE